MAATDTGEAILVGLSYGGLIACVLAAHHPERVKAAILAGTAALIGPAHSYMMPQHFQAQQQQFEGWNKYNRAHWLVDYPDFAEHFVRNIFSEPHRPSKSRTASAGPRETDGPVLVKTSRHARSCRRSTSARRCIARSPVRCSPSMATATRSNRMRAASWWPS
jgi:pimeloyl-ACP methyl ester carboxylesterase